MFLHPQEVWRMQSTNKNFTQTHSMICVQTYFIQMRSIECLKVIITLVPAVVIKDSRSPVLQWWPLGPWTTVVIFFRQSFHTVRSCHGPPCVLGLRGLAVGEASMQLRPCRSHDEFCCKGKKPGLWALKTALWLLSPGCFSIQSWRRVLLLPFLRHLTAPPRMPSTGPEMSWLYA